MCTVSSLFFVFCAASKIEFAWSKVISMLRIETDRSDRATLTTHFGTFLINATTLRGIIVGSVTTIIPISDERGNAHTMWIGFNPADTYLVGFMIWDAAGKWDVCGEDITPVLRSWVICDV